MDKQAIYGQYFTENAELQEKVCNFILNEPNIILEPSIGRGDIVVAIKRLYSDEVTFDMHEIDTTITMLPEIDTTQIHFGDFMQCRISKKYTTIVGNPPYVRTKSGNLYIDFIEKCVDLLEDDIGELIFIVPSDVFKLTCAAKLLEQMMQQGTFTHIFHPHNEHLFAGASIDIVIFRYCKNPELPKQVLYNDIRMSICNVNGMITFKSIEDSATIDGVLISDYFDVYVGLVSGKEEVFKHKTLGNITVLNGENKRDKYIYSTTFPMASEEINTYLQQHKDTLITRKIRKFDETNWYQWGAPRNVKIMETHRGKQCIYIYNLSRKYTVAFCGKVEYFGGNLIMLLPKAHCGNQCDLKKLVAYFNSDEFRQNFTFSGRFKIGHRHICNSIVPANIIMSN